MSNYNLISCDDHLDLGQLPADLWTARLPASQQDRAPHIEERGGQALWISDGKVWGRWQGRIRPEGAAIAPSPVISALERAGVDNEGQRRPGVARLRLEDMDRDGVYAHVMFGPVTSINVEEPQFRDELHRVYNDWLKDFCAPAPDRLLGVPMLPEDPEAATKAFIAQFLDPFVDLFAWGILERHPKIRIVMAEAGLGWLPWVVQELDYRHWRLWESKAFWADKGGIALKEKPSDLFKRQVYVTFQEDHVAMQLLDFYGAGNVLWASDYPHPDSVWPNSHAAIERQMGHLTPEVRKRLTHDNAAALYGLKT